MSDHSIHANHFSQKELSYALNEDHIGRKSWFLVSLFNIILLLLSFKRQKWRKDRVKEKKELGRWTKGRKDSRGRKNVWKRAVSLAKPPEEFGSHRINLVTANYLESLTWVVKEQVGLQINIPYSAKKNQSWISPLSQWIILC
jgi:hypothetical protein